jgi:hypothetical protein
MGPRVRGDDIAFLSLTSNPIPIRRDQRDRRLREGVIMQKWFWAAAALLVAYPAFAANVATCTLGADRKTVTVTASNPYPQVLACEVNCHMDLPGGFATVVCVKPVPVGAKDFVMCTDVSTDGHAYTKVKETEANCPR